MADDQAYCQNLVREADKDRFLATLFAPADRRADLFALYAFDLETAAVARRVSDPVIGEVRLQWWHDCIAGAAETGGHPVAQALRDVLVKHGISEARALALIDARRSALYEMEEGDAALEVHAGETAGAVFAMAAQILAGAPDEAARLASHHAGVVALAPDGGALSRTHRAALRALVPHLPQAALPAFLPLVVAIEGRAQLPQWRRQWMLWRAAKNLAAWL
jgi:phytoene synthase